MIPKEKAEELVNKMERPMDGVSIFRLAAKQLAIIAVDEMLKNDGWSGSHEEWIKFTNYFEEVKNEIFNL